MGELGGIPHNGQGPVSVGSDEYWRQKCIDACWAGMTGGKMPEVSKPDKVNPDHYTSDGIECHSVQRAVLGAEGMASYWHGCAIKYLFRALKKNGAEDIRKAIRCLQFWLEEPDVKK